MYNRGKKKEIEGLQVEAWFRNNEKRGAHELANLELDER